MGELATGVVRGTGRRSRTGVGAPPNFYVRDRSFDETKLLLML